MSYFKFISDAVGDMVTGPPKDYKAVVKQLDGFDYIKIDPALTVLTPNPPKQGDTIHIEMEAEVLKYMAYHATVCRVYALGFMVWDGYFDYDDDNYTVELFPGDTFKQTVNYKIQPVGISLNTRFELKLFGHLTNDDEVFTLSAEVWL